MEITYQTFLIVCPFLFLAGLIDAIGGGGGLISLPAYLIAGLPPHAAVATNKMVLVKGDNALEKCKEYNLDGVVKQIDTSKPLKVQVKSLREALKKKTLGVIIPARRHEAMLAGEVEPEFIAFYSDNKDKDDDIISWYNDLFLMPLAWVCETSIDSRKKDMVDFMIVSAENF